MLALCGSGSAAYACDLEGFGFSRVNPFGQRAAWNVPDKPTPADQSNSATLGVPERSDTASSAPSATRIPAADRAVLDRIDAAASSKSSDASKQTSAERARRFTATKD